MSNIDYPANSSYTSGSARGIEAFHFVDCRNEPPLSERTTVIIFMLLCIYDLGVRYRSHFKSLISFSHHLADLSKYTSSLPLRVDGTGSDF